MTKIHKAAEENEVFLNACKTGNTRKIEEIIDDFTRGIYVWILIWFNCIIYRQIIEKNEISIQQSTKLLNFLGEISLNMNFSVTQEQLISVLEKNIKAVIAAEIKCAGKPFEPPFTEYECRKMNLPRLKYEVATRGLVTVGSGKGGAVKKIDYIDALLGRQKPRIVVRNSEWPDILLTWDMSQVKVPL